MERNLLLTIEYDGSEFSGWQRQPARRTVQGELEKVLSKVCGVPVMINGTSRTDAGVHALGQRASFKLNSGIPTDKIKLAANNILAGGKNLASQVGDVRILDVQEMPEDFHARFDSKGKKYRYVISNSPEQVEQYRSGKDRLFDYFVGQVMKNTRGKANPVITKELLHKKLDI